MGLSQNAVDPARASTGANPYTGSLSASGVWSANSALGQSANAQSANMGAGEGAPAYTQKDGQVWTIEEILATAQQKGISPQKVLQMIKQNDV